MVQWSAKHLVILLAFALSIVGVTGCGSSDSGATSGGATMDDLAATLDTPEPATMTTEDASTTETPLAQQPIAEASPAEQSTAMTRPAAPASPPSDGRAVAGRAPIGEGGYFVAIGGARRQILNRVEDLAWTQAVQHFQATEGRLPRDHNEFMTKIVEPLGIDLGFKEEDQEFLYDPNEGRWGTVFVVAKEPAPAP